MKDNKEGSGEELMDIDEKGEPIQIKKEEEKKAKPLSKSNIAIIFIVCLIISVHAIVFSPTKKIIKVSLMKQFLKT